MPNHQAMKPCTIAALAPAGGHLMIFAAGCFILVVLAHVCEADALFPSMGWGLSGAPAIVLTCAPRSCALLCFPQVV
jgi:hypothetical protein